MTQEVRCMDLDLEDERLTELPQRFETSNTNFAFSPITVNVTQVAVALNAGNAGGSQGAFAANASTVHVG